MQPATIIPINTSIENAELKQLRREMHEIREELGLGTNATHDEVLSKINEANQNETHAALMLVRAERRVPKTRLQALFQAVRLGR